MIESIRLKNFRKHEDITIELDENFNLIHGKNNAGKSTIFYGIEYCLFGGVHGFKKISQLTNFNKNAVGVQLTFKGRDGALYKLQRVHKLSGKSRSAKGYFTLKKIVDDGEIYLLSSDHGDREEDLSLKIKELLGISKRFFETGVHFYQGSVSEILRGDKKLDIVFGIKAASALADEFGGYALELEKEIKYKDALKATLEQARKEKTEYQKSFASQKKEQENIAVILLSKEQELNQFNQIKDYSQFLNESIENFEKIMKDLENIRLKEEMLKNELKEHEKNHGTHQEIEKQVENVKNKLESIKKTLIESEKKIDTIEKEIRSLESEKVQVENLKMKKMGILKEVDDITKETGNSEVIEKKVINMKAELQEISKELSQLEKENNNLQEYFRNAEREKGDIEGILKRREESKYKPICEYCGNPIDPSKITEDIKKYKSKLNKINDEIRNNEKKKESMTKRMNELRKNEKELNKRLVNLEVLLHKIKSLEAQLNNELNQDFEKILENLSISHQSLENSINSEKQELNKLREEESGLKIKYNEFRGQLNRFNDLKKKFQNVEIESREIEKNHVEKKQSLISTFLTVKTNLTDIANSFKNKETNEKKSVTEELTTIITKIGNAENNFSMETITDIKEHLKEFTIAKISEISTSIDHLHQQKDTMETHLEEIKNNLKRLDKEIAKTAKEIEILEKKEKLVKKYRFYQEVFKEIQGMIRENACSILEKHILEFHDLLSTTKEFKKIHVDKDDYSLYATPKGIPEKEFYPSWLYEGGGQKLILGISYKFSLGNIIGKAPFLLIDEPTEFMDRFNRVNLLSNLANILKDHQVLLITHQDVDKIKCNKKIEIV